MAAAESIKDRKSQKTTKGPARLSGPGKNISAVTRAFVIVEKLALVSSSSLEELARATKLAKPTVYRFLLTLRELGYARKDEGDRWFLTMKLFAVGSKTLDHIDLPSVARPIATKLSADLGETVHMGVLDEGEALYILKIESKYTIRMYSRVGKKIPLYCTAIGKLLLADMDQIPRAAVIDSLKLVPFTPHTLRDAISLEAELEKIRSQAWSTDAEEHEQGILCLAAPIRDHQGRTVAALSASWPAFRFENARREEYITRIQAAAAEISAVLGAEG